MWKRCEAAEQLAAEKRQRKNAAKRAKQEPSKDIHKLSQQPLEVDICSMLSFMKHVDGNLSAVIHRCAAMLETAQHHLEAGQRMPAQEIYSLGLADAGKIGRMLQKELRQRSVICLCLGWATCTPAVGCGV